MNSRNLSDLVSKSRVAVSLRADRVPTSGLRSDTRNRLRNVVGRLVADAVRFYDGDQDILDKMSEEALEAAVLEYLSKRDAYDRGLLARDRKNDC